ncbi:hypothetical protein ACHAPA_007567 [Fusarium lateritium]
MEMVLGGQLELHLLQGCCLEAERADCVAIQLVGLRHALTEGTHSHLLILMEEIRISGQWLRELAEYSNVHFSRVPVVLDYLEILLPCLSRSLRDITSYYEDRTLTKENRWRKMYHSMTQEAEAPPPIRKNSAIRPESILDDDSGIGTNVHWAEKIFSLPLLSRTALKHQQSSKVWGPHVPWDQVRMPSDARVLLIRSFNERQVNLIVYESGRDRCPYFLLRTFHMGTPWFSLRGAHELCVERNGSSLQFWQWSANEQCSKRWANLCFLTWEELVLVYCCFLSFKARNSLTIQVATEDLTLWGERKLFQARIVDDGFMHSLIVYEDYMTKGLRLHAAVWDGDLQQCPVWTAFVTHQSTSPKWIKRVSKTRVRLADIQLYVFCQEYRQQNQRINRAGAFEIRFISEEAAKRFREVFAPMLTDESTMT